MIAGMHRVDTVVEDWIFRRRPPPGLHGLATIRLTRLEQHVRRRRGRRRPQRSRLGGLPRARRTLGPGPRATRVTSAARRSPPTPFDGHPAVLSRYAYLVSLLPEQILEDLGLDLRLASRPDGVVHARGPRRQARGLLVERPEGRADPQVVPRPHRRRPGVRRLALVLRRGRGLARVVAPTLLAAAADRADRGRGRRPGDLARVRRRCPLGRGHRAPVRRRHRPRRRGHRRPDRHLRVHERRVARAEPVLPLPPDRQRHRRVAGAGRRHGRGDRRAARPPREVGRGDPHRRRRERDPGRRRRGRGHVARRVGDRTRSQPGSCWPTSRRGCCTS